MKFHEKHTVLYLENILNMFYSYLIYIFKKAYLRFFNKVYGNGGLQKNGQIN